MTDVKRLLALATSLPWQHSGPGWTANGDQMWLTGDGHRHQMIAWTDASGRAAVDLKLAALAVNRLPDYEAAVDALERLVDAASVEEEDWSLRSHGELMAALNQAGAALVRLQEKVS